jgi:uncharacterized protein (DUF1684 family)
MTAHADRQFRRCSLVLAFAVLAALAALAGCGRKAPAVEPGYEREIESWRAARLAALTAEDGWLTVTGLYWLEPGHNSFGAAPENTVVLRGKGVPPVAGVLELRPDGTVFVYPRAGAGVTLDGAPPPDRALRSDRSGRPDVLRIAAVRFYVIDRAGKLAVRVKDPDNPARARFEGIRSFPVDPAYRVDGTLEPYAAPREVTVATAQGPQQKMLAPGLVRFTLAGKALALEPFVSSPDDRTYMFVFRDLTGGVETYGAGRFLDTAAPQDGSRRVVLDFNKAYSPPCAFTPFATCPLPPRQNELPLRIEAGEKQSGTH